MSSLLSTLPDCSLFVKQFIFDTSLNATSDGFNPRPGAVNLLTKCQRKMNTSMDGKRTPILWFCEQPLESDRYC